jgi:hypothetical protein
MRHCDACDFYIPYWHKLDNVAVKFCVCTHCCLDLAIRGTHFRGFSKWEISTLCKVPYLREKKIRKKPRKKHKSREKPELTIDTGIEVIAIPSAENTALITWDLSDIDCPNCQNMTLVLTLEIDADCPKCKMGKIQEDGTWVDP